MLYRFSRGAWLTCENAVLSDPVSSPKYPLIISFTCFMKFSFLTTAFHPLPEIKVQRELNFQLLSIKSKPRGMAPRTSFHTRIFFHHCRMKNLWRPQAKLSGNAHHIHFGVGSNILIEQEELILAVQCAHPFQFPYSIKY